MTSIAAEYNKPMRAAFADMPRSENIEDRRFYPFSVEEWLDPRHEAPPEARWLPHNAMEPFASSIENLMGRNHFSKLLDARLPPALLTLMNIRDNR